LKPSAAAAATLQEEEDEEHVATTSATAKIHESNSQKVTKTNMPC
jgi:hypothetical protein